MPSSSPRPAQWLLCDDGFSQNGTFVNGLRIHGRRRLVDGDLVRIGHTTLRVPATLAATGITMAPAELGAAPKFSDQQHYSCRCRAGPDRATARA